MIRRAHDCKNEEEEYILHCQEFPFDKNLYLEFSLFKDYHYQDGLRISVKYCPICGYKAESDGKNIPLNDKNIFIEKPTTICHKYNKISGS